MLKPCGPVRELTTEERFVWGDCSVCKAPHGQPCHAEVGIQLGTRLETGEGVHLARLQGAPLKVREVPVD